MLACHIATGRRQPLFTDFTYDNLGVPKNPRTRSTTSPPGTRRRGLGRLRARRLPAGGRLRRRRSTQPELGKHKVPTLRNVDLRPSTEFVKAYGHNGYFKSLEEIVHFYNTRDVAGAGWPAPEVP